jgi:hypothetical protein
MLASASPAAHDLHTLVGEQRPNDSGAFFALPMEREGHSHWRVRRRLLMLVVVCVKFVFFVVARVR